MIPNQEPPLSVKFLAFAIIGGLVLTLFLTIEAQEAENKKYWKEVDCLLAQSRFPVPDTDHYYCLNHINEK